MSAYDRHWARLAELLGPEEAAAERQRMTEDERADRRAAKIEQFKTGLTNMRRWLAEAEAEGRDSYAARLRKQIAYREQEIAKEENQ